MYSPLMFIDTYIHDHFIKIFMKFKRTIQRFFAAFLRFSLLFFVSCSMSEHTQGQLHGAFKCTSKTLKSTFFLHFRGHKHFLKQESFSFFFL